MQLEDHSTVKRIGAKAQAPAIVSHKPIAVEAGLGQMGIHRNPIHPRFGNFVLLSTVLTELEVEAYDHPIEYNPLP
jgi:epoxyqueuosine reductase QueG